MRSSCSSVAWSKCTWSKREEGEERKGEGEGLGGEGGWWVSEVLSKQASAGAMPAGHPVSTRIAVKSIPCKELGAKNHANVDRALLGTEKQGQVRW